MKAALSLSTLLLATLPVAVQPPAGKTLDAEFEAVLHPYRSVEISAATDGILASILVDRGDRVQRDRLLATLDSSIESAALELARARAGSDSSLRIARLKRDESARKCRRQEALFTKGITSQERLDEFIAAKELAALELSRALEQQELSELELRRAEALLEKRMIKSPIDGVVTARHLSRGELVSRSRGSVILEAAQLDPLILDVRLPVELLGQVHAGMCADVQPEGPRTPAYTGQVTVVDPVVDAASGTFGVRIEIENDDLSLAAGLLCKVRLRE